MDALTRVESRILDVQARIAQLGGRRTVAPAAGSGTSTAGEMTSGVAPFREIADAAQRAAQVSPGAAGALRAVSYGASAAGVVAAGATKTPGTFGPITLPSAILGMRNGQLPDVALEAIGQGEHRLERSAAVAFRRMASAAALDGVTLSVSDSYRSLAAQQQTAADL